MISYYCCGWVVGLVVYLDVNHDKHVSLFGIKEVTLKPSKISNLILQQQNDTICVKMYDNIKNNFGFCTLLVLLKIS